MIPRAAVLVALPVAVVVGGLFVQKHRLDRRVDGEARELWSARASAPPAQAPLEALPAPVRRYLERSGATTRAPVRAVRLRHGGTFRPALDRPWFPIEAEQYFATDVPGFVWHGRIRMAPGLWIHARDRSIAGEGHMLVLAAATWKLGDVRGPEMDQGALLRLLAEMVWFPTAFLDARHVRWEPVDDHRARATLDVRGREVSATFAFGPDGLVASVAADRYRDVNGKGVLTPWGGTFGDYRLVDGLRIPFRSEVSWQVGGRAEPYARWAFEQVEYDRPEPW